MEGDDVAIHASLRLIEQLYRTGHILAALAACEQVLAARPNNVRLLAMSGTLAGECGNPQLAVELLTAADRLRPEQPDILFNLGVALKAIDDHAAASVTFAKAVASRADHVEAWFGLAQSLQRTGNSSAALAAYRKVTALKPHHPGANHMAAALAGENPPTPPDGYTRALFDDYAARFDAELVGQLSYHTPEELRAAIVTVAPTRRFRSALDLGCGTGLAGVALTDLVDEMHGVDASPAMLARAAARGVYNELEVGDLIARMLRATCHGERFDLIFAADVLVYLGALDAVMTAAAACLTTGGLFAFSVERLSIGSYQLRLTGRYAHSQDYIAHLAATAGLSIAHHCEAALRQDGVRPVSGNLYVLRSPPAARQ